MKISKLTTPIFSVYLLIILTLIIRLIIAASTGLGIGESYYFEGAKNLQLSYYDQPPLFFWLAGLSIRLFGLSSLALRLPTVLLFAGSTWLIYLIGKKLFNEWAGFYSAFLLNISLVFAVPVAVWLQPDSPLIFFWLLSVYFIILILFPLEAKKRNSPEIYVLWILTGISIGLTTLSKYHAIFLMAGVFLFILLNKSQRFWIRHPGFYIALVINLIVSLPIIIWNYHNHWASFIFQGSRAGEHEFHLHFDWLLRSIIGQALWLAPWIWIPLIKELFFSFKSGKNNPVYSFCFWTSILPILFFTIITLWTSIGFHFHWQAPGYMMLFLPLGATIVNKIGNGDKSKLKVKRWLIFSALFTVVFGAVFLVQSNTGFWRSYGPGWLVTKFGGKYDPTIEGHDYVDIQERFEKEGWMNNPKIFVCSLRWWEAGKIDWALKGEKKLILLHFDPRNHAYFVNPKSLLGQDAILVGEKDERDYKNNVVPFFDSIKALDDIDIKRRGIKEFSIKVYYCYNFHVPLRPKPDLPVYKQLIGRPPF